MSKRRKTGGGRFDPSEPAIYFSAGSDIGEIGAVHRWNLAAVNDLTGENARTRDLDELLDDGNVVLLGSGIFWLTQRHMRHHPRMTMDEALALPPEDVEGFDWLWDAYLGLVEEFEDRLWGYIELDQGGAERKRETRAKLEELGLRPIPVYHPLVDGWDYFDELAEHYDRICLGNVVQANARTRKHLLATAWERRRRYPELWIHVLGLTVNEFVTVYPMSSYDSSSWVYAVRYGAQSAPGAHAMGDSFGTFTTTFSYDTGLGKLDPGGQRDGVAFLASEATFMQSAMRRQASDLAELFGDDALLPPPDEREGVRC
jgi:hypothetical protein